MQSDLDARIPSNLLTLSNITNRLKIKIAPAEGAILLVCGERGIRTPGPLTVNGFQDRRVRPLCHLSGAKIR